MRCRQIGQVLQALAGRRRVGRGRGRCRAHDLGQAVADAGPVVAAALDDVAGERQGVVARELRLGQRGDGHGGQRDVVVDERAAQVRRRQQQVRHLLGRPERLRGGRAGREEGDEELAVPVREVDQGKRGGVYMRGKVFAVIFNVVGQDGSHRHVGSGDAGGKIGDDKGYSVE